MVSSLVIALLQSLSIHSPATVQSVKTVDSARIIRSVRSAQSSFEWFRRSHLPVGYGFSGPCEVRIGRYCYWRGDERDNEKPPAESPDIGKRRNELIGALDSAARSLAGDAWIAGQYVRYLVEAERFDDATQFARDTCRASASWCAALSGYAAHSGNRFAAADSAYSTALAAMEPAERCRWLDVSKLLTDELERRFTSIECGAREQWIRRVFWLAAPMYSVSTSDLLTEHLARLTRSRIAEQSATIDGESWADDQRELMTRYGWPRWYSRALPSVYSSSQLRPSITGHDAGMPYDFFPALAAVDHVGATAPNHWRLDNPQATTGYAPTYARTIHDVPSQIAAFRRGDSTLIVASWDARRDTTLLGRSLDAALVLASDGELRGVTRGDSSKVVGRLSVAGLVDSGTVSLELLAKEDKRAARVRVGVPARSVGRVALSDLLLYSPTAEAVSDLDAIRDSSLASTIVSGSRAVGVFWEAYGLRPQSEVVHFSLTVEQVGVGWMRRAAERLRLADPTSGLRIQWQEVPKQDAGVAGRGVRLDLSRLRGGRYSVRLTIEANGETPFTVVREIEVR